MKYLKFTHVDSVTGISVVSAPARNGPSHPAIVGLQFVWARESAYPTNTPEFFGTCPDDSDTQIDGVTGVFTQADWEQMQRDEMHARPSVNAAVYAQLAAADMKIIRALAEGDTARIAAHKAAQAELRAGLR